MEESDAFVETIEKSLEMFINRMQTVTSKGKHIAMDSTVQVKFSLLAFCLDIWHFVRKYRSKAPLSKEERELLGREGDKIIQLLLDLKKTNYRTQVGKTMPLE